MQVFADVKHHHSNHSVGRLFPQPTYSTLADESHQRHPYHSNKITTATNYDTNTTYAMGSVNMKNDDSEDAVPLPGSSPMGYIPPGKY
jgi:hypothetical protein